MMMMHSPMMMPDKGKGKSKAGKMRAMMEWMFEHWSEWYGDDWGGDWGGWAQPSYGAAGMGKGGCMGKGGAPIVARAAPYSGAMVPQEEASNEEVESFLRRNQVEPHCAQRLLNLDPALQKVVLNKGSLAEARDPNAVLMARIKQVVAIASGQFDAAGMKSGDWICPGCMDHQFAKNDACRRCGTPKSASIQQNLSRVAQQLGGGPGVPSKAQPATEEEVHRFFAQHSFEPHAQEKFLNLDPSLQKLVINRGDMVSVRDQTAVLVSRIGQVTRIANGQFDGLLKEGDWICPGCFDHQFAKNMSCRQCGTGKPDGGGQQPPLMSQGSDWNGGKGKWSQSTPVLPFMPSQYSQGKSQPSQGKAVLRVGSSPGVEQAEQYEVEAFLSEHMVEPHIKERMLALDPTLQKLVINQGDLHNARDQTAVLATRISQVSKMASGGLQFEQGKLKAGDWICPNCWDHNFSKNTSCRKCGTPREQSSEKFQASFGDDLQVPMLLDQATPEEVRTFLVQNPVEPHAEEWLMSMDPKLQRIVLNKGPMHEARDRTAMLMGRMKQVSRVAAGDVKMEMRPGDWLCQGCFDVQFSRNTTCRQCGAMRP